MSSSSTQPPRRRPNSVLPRTRTVAGRTQGRLRLNSSPEAPRSWWRRATRRIRRFTGRVFSARVWTRIGRLTTWIGAVGVAVAAFTGLISSNHQYRLSQQAQIITEQGQITDRFTKAVEQLGSDKSLDVRLGGIFSLERLARDSKGDYPTVMEVLTAYVRGHSPVVGSDDQLVTAATVVPCAESSKLPIDIEAVVTVISRRDPTVPLANPIDLSGSCLHNVTYSGATLAGADLTGADLTGANLTGAFLTGADLTGAELTGADLTGANLTGAFLTDADLTRAELTGAELTGAKLTGADLTGADLTGANLTDADLFGANLTGAFLTGANLTGANLNPADLTNATLKRIIYDSSTTWPNGFTPPPSS